MRAAMMTDPREAKLPRWVQAHLQSLRMEVNTLTAALEEAKGNIPDTDTFSLDYIRGNKPLPKGARIGFVMRPETEFPGRHQIQCYVEHGWLQVQGDYSLRVQPRSSNCLMMRLEDSR